MPPTGDRFFALEEVGGLPHPQESIPSHLQPGASDMDLLQNSAALSVETRQLGSWIRVAVTVKNTGAGHHLPTDHPGRHLILTIEVEDGQGQQLSQVAGPRVPDWGGPQAGQPGTVFAKVLRDLETGEQPVVNYWRPSAVAADNRIPARESDVSVYYFSAPTSEDTVTISAELRFRRIFQPLMDAKGWPTPDIIMEKALDSTSVEPWQIRFLPILINQ